MLNMCQVTSANHGFPPQLDAINLSKVSPLLSYISLAVVTAWAQDTMSQGFELIGNDIQRLNEPWATATFM